MSVSKFFRFYDFPNLGNAQMVETVLLDMGFLTKIEKVYNGQAPVHFRLIVDMDGGTVDTLFPSEG